MRAELWSTRSGTAHRDPAYRQAALKSYPPGCRKGQTTCNGSRCQHAEGPGFGQDPKQLAVLQTKPTPERPPEPARAKADPVHRARL